MSTVDEYTVLSQAIEGWIEDTGGRWFSAREIDREFDLRARKDKQNRWIILKRLCVKGELEKHPTKSNEYRFISELRDEMDWFNADLGNFLPIRFPLELERHCRIYPKSIIIVSGVFNTGKTAFMLNVAEMNMHSFPVKLFNSEMGPEEFKLRLNASGASLEEWHQQVKVYERNRDFSDVIFPDALNIIDYLEIEEDFFAIGKEIGKIFRRLTTGVAVIALQKKAGATLGRGQEFSVEKARLAVSIDPGELTIVKAKNWADPAGPNPNGTILKFKLVQGYKFISDGQTWRGQTDATQGGKQYAKK
ncbi:MAG: hypothetical protein IMZ61_15035 [Planctomycetes bacterium]|nr:hypothetical protein [Planctomycetota bacterium]